MMLVLRTCMSARMHPCFAGCSGCCCHAALLTRLCVLSMYNCDRAGCWVLHSQNAASRPVLERSHHASQCRGPCSCSHLATRIKQQWSEPLHGIGSQRHGLTAAFARGPAACYSILRQPGACSTNVDVLDCALGACAAHNCLPDDAHTVIEDAHSEQLCEACVGLTTVSSFRGACLRLIVLPSAHHLYTAC